MDEKERMYEQNSSLDTFRQMYGSSLKIKEVDEMEDRIKSFFEILIQIDTKQKRQ